MDLKLGEAKLKTKQTTLDAVNNKRKKLGDLKNLQANLFDSITKKIIDWYKNTYKGNKNNGENYLGKCSINAFIPEVDLQANKFYFVANHGFNYLLPE